MNSNFKTTYLKKLWQQAPLSWALIRTPECILLSQQRFTPPILEIGCGDGLVSSIIFKGKRNAITTGIDIDTDELLRARKTGIYKNLVQVDITKNNFPDNSFNTVFANGVLEHIPSLAKTLKEVARILKPGGVLITTSPTDNYTRLLFYYQIFSIFRLPQLGRLYGKKINQIFAHRHLLSLEQWSALFQKTGLTLDEHTYYNNPCVIMMHDLCLPFSLFSKTVKKKTDKMVIFPEIRKHLVISLAPFVSRIVKTPSDPSQAASIFLRGRKL